MLLQDFPLDLSCRDQNCGQTGKETGATVGGEEIKASSASSIRQRVDTGKVAIPHWVEESVSVGGSLISMCL